MSGASTPNDSSVTPAAGKAYGGGGAGAGHLASVAAQAGGAGATGVVIVTTYS
jgi:hypothetical protein